MNFLFVGAFNEKRCTFNIQGQEGKGINLLLPASYAFVNLYFSIRNSTIMHAQRTKDLFGIFMDCDFSSKSPIRASTEDASKLKEQHEDMVRRYNFFQSAEQNEQRSLR